MIRDCGSVVFATTLGRCCGLRRRDAASPAAVAALAWAPVAAWTTRRARSTRVDCSIGTGGRPIGRPPAARIAAWRSSLAWCAAISRARCALASASRCGPSGIRPTTGSPASERRRRASAAASRSCCARSRRRACLVTSCAAWRTRSARWLRSASRAGTLSPSPSPRPPADAASSAASAARASSRIWRTCWSSHSWPRLASIDAFAGILVPSIATVPRSRQPCGARDFEHLGEQGPESTLVPGAEPRDRRVIGTVLGAQNTESHIGQAPALDLPRRPHPQAVRIDQQSQQHVRVIARRPSATHPPAGVKTTGVQRIDRFQQEPHHVIRRQPLPHIRRHQKRLIPQHPAIRLSHTI